MEAGGGAEAPGQDDGATPKVKMISIPVKQVYQTTIENMTAKLKEKMQTVNHMTESEADKFSATLQERWLAKLSQDYCIDLSQAAARTRGGRDYRVRVSGLGNGATARRPTALGSPPAVMVPRRPRGGSRRLMLLTNPPTGSVRPSSLASAAGAGSRPLQGGERGQGEDGGHAAGVPNPNPARAIMPTRNPFQSRPPTSRRAVGSLGPDQPEVERGKGAKTSANQGQKRRRDEHLPESMTVQEMPTMSTNERGDGDAVLPLEGMGPSQPLPPPPPPPPPRSARDILLADSDDEGEEGEASTSHNETTPQLPPEASNPPPRLEGLEALLLNDSDDDESGGETGGGDEDGRMGDSGGEPRQQTSKTKMMGLSTLLGTEGQGIESLVGPDLNLTADAGLLEWDRNEEMEEEVMERPPPKDARYLSYEVFFGEAARGMEEAKATERSEAAVEEEVEIGSDLDDSDMEFPSQDPSRPLVFGRLTKLKHKDEFFDGVVEDCLYVSPTQERFVGKLRFKFKVP